MPLLQFDTTLSSSSGERTSFAETVTDLYTTEMATTAGHVAVTIRERAPVARRRAVDSVSNHDRPSGRNVAPAGK